MNVSFGSTYRIPFRKGGESVRQSLRDLAKQYGGLATQNKSANGTARVSISNKLDAQFEQDLRKIGYREYQKFDAEALPQDKIDAYIKEQLGDFNYTQKGKQKSGKPKKKELYN